MINSFLNPKGHQHPVSGSKVTAILLKGWIWPIGEASAGEGLRLQPAQTKFEILICQNVSFEIFRIKVIDVGNILSFEFSSNLYFSDFSQFHFFLVLSQFELLSFVTNLIFCTNLRFCVCHN